MFTNHIITEPVRLLGTYTEYAQGLREKIAQAWECTEAPSFANAIATKYGGYGTEAHMFHNVPLEQCSGPYPLMAIYRDAGGIPYIVFGLPINARFPFHPERTLEALMRLVA